ncbi:hypothetical protein MRX96_015876 [Rhipicephalus microplus]
MYCKTTRTKVSLLKWQNTWVPLCFPGQKTLWIGGRPMAADCTQHWPRSERLFSTAGNVVTSRRELLLPDHVEQLVFLHENLRVQ